MGLIPGIDLGPIDDIWDGFTDFVEDVYEKFKDIAEDLVEGFFQILGITDETVHAVAVSTSRLITEEPKDPIKNIIFRHAIKNTSIARLLQRQQLIGVGRGIVKYHAYGDDTFYYGLPTLSSFYHDRRQSAIDTVLTTIEGEAITVSAIRYYPLTIEEHIKFWLQENTTYTYHNNTLTSGGDDYKYKSYSIDEISGNYDVVIERVQNTTATTYLETTIETVGGTETTTIKEHTITIDDDTMVELSDVYSPGSDTSTQPDQGNPDSVTDLELFKINTSTTIPHDIGQEVPAATLNELFYIVEYSLDSAPDNTKIWLYDRTTGVYPTLDLITPSGSGSTLVLPIVPLRDNFVDADDDINGTPYKTSKQLLNIVGINIDLYLNAIRTNPQKEYIQDAFILFALNIYTTSQGGIKAFMNLFTDLEEIQDVTKADYLAHPPGSNSPVNNFKISEQKFNTVIQYNYIESLEDVSGVIGDEGKYYSELTILPNSDIVTPPDDPDTGTTPPDYGNQPRSYITFRYQKTETTYNEISVHGLILTTGIFVTGSEARINIIELEASTKTDNQRDNFVIPLSYTQIIGDSLKPSTKLTMHEEESVIAESLVMVIYAKRTEYLEYYETPSFFNLLNLTLQFVSLVMLIASFGSSSTYSQALIEFGKRLLIQYALTLVLDEILEHNIDDTTRALVLSTYAYLTYLNITSGSAANGLSFADQLMTATHAITDALTHDLSAKFDVLYEEKKEFEELLLSRQEELDRITDGTLSTEDRLNRYEIYKIIKMNTHETPQQFYDRTIHNNNPGVLALDEIHDYYNNALKLPKFDGTVKH